jgi:copper chaperone CopZ
MKTTLYCVAVATLVLSLTGSSVLAQKPSPSPKAARPAARKCDGCKPGEKKTAGKHDPCAVPMTLTLSGLHCGGCEGVVTKGLMAVKGVEEATVSAKEQRATVWVCPHKGVKPEALKAAVVKAGYKVVKIEKGEIKPASTQ